MHKSLTFALAISFSAAHAAAPLKGCYDTDVPVGAARMTARLVFADGGAEQDMVVLLPKGAADGDIYLSDLTCSRGLCTLTEDGGGFSITRKGTQAWLETDRAWSVVPGSGDVRLVPTKPPKKVKQLLQALKPAACAAFKKDIKP